MTDAAGLALGLVATWNVYVQAFDIAASRKRYVMDYEIARVKLEVERIRLFTWSRHRHDPEFDPTLP
jgi:Prion-inhibition and propagation